MPGLTVAYIASQEGSESVPKGKLDRDYLRQFVSPGTRCYLCGPPPMMTVVKGALEELGVTGDDLIADDW